MLNRDLTNPVRGIELSRARVLPPIPVLWWSSNVVRLAQQRLIQLRDSGGPAQPLDAPNLPDYVLAIEGSEPLRILRDPAQDLHDTVFLELPDGVTIDLRKRASWKPPMSKTPGPNFTSPAKSTAAQPSTLIPNASFSTATPQPRPLAKPG